MEGPEEEKKRKKKALITTICIQAVLLLLLYFLVAWREPNPPNPEFGIELNFGLNDTGSGNEPVQSTTQSETTETETTESTETDTNESRDSNEQKTPVDPVKNPNADVAEEKAEASKPKQTQSTTQKPTENSNTSQGETGDKGDQGKPEGDDKGLYTGDKGGGDNGSSLALAGWVWDEAPKPNDTSDEAGKIVFEIVVDSEGYLTSYKVLTSTVSQAVLQKYSAAVQQLTFSKTSTYKPAPSSKGTITFIIRAN